MATKMTKVWADKPYELIPTPTEEETKGVHKEVIWVATDMVLAHNMILLNLNAIYQQCTNITLPTDISDFILFSQCVIEEARTHHDMEEANLFPQIAEYTGDPSIMSRNIEQHHAFEEALDVLEKYLYAVKVEEYDGEKLRGLLEAFAGKLVPHLRDEIPTLLELRNFEGKPLGVLYKKFNEKIMASVKDKNRVLPCGLGSIDRTFEGGKHNFPPFPFFVPYLVQYVFARKHRGSWRFSPCTMFGQPKELPFAKAA